MTRYSLHTRSFTAAEDFADQDVLVVGGGTSALQFLLQLDAAGARTVWTTRRTPDWAPPAQDATWGIAVEEMVSDRTRRGLPPLSVAAATGLPLDEQYTDGIRAGLLVTRGPLRRIAPAGVVLQGPGPDGRGVPSQGELADGIRQDPLVEPVRALPGAAPQDNTADDSRCWFTPVDTILWATGFRATLGHLAALRLREPGGGVRMDEDGVSVSRVPGLYLVGYGASASTVGATRAGRRAAVASLRDLELAAS